MEKELKNNSEQNPAVDTVVESVDDVIAPSEVPASNEEIPTEDKVGFWDVKKVLGSVAVAFVVITALVLISNNPGQHVAVKQFTNVYSFVPEKISRSAAIPISLPTGVDEAVAQASISFSPAVVGSWQTEELAGVVVFVPKTPLKSGVYYAVNMDTGSVQMSGDFYVDEDPKIDAIFPAVGSETPEDTEITIVFNRPMVPLTTLTEQEKTSIPVTITPETPGTFKWISTRNLQFIPETTLLPSSNYTVEVKAGFFSLDGLAVAPLTHTFITRPLRYEFLPTGQIGYRSPIIIDFNQPVDLNQTRRQISVSKQEGGNINIEVKYGEVTYYDRESRQYVTESDPSKLFIYQKRDSHGRADLWDFDTSYRVAITGAVPLFGTNNLTESRNANVSVPSIIESVTAQSDRSSLVSPDFFDPQGTLTVTFYDDVDKDRSNIALKGLTKVAYGERCQTDSAGNSIQVGSGCELENDKSTLIFSFNADSFTTDESFNLEFKQIVTPEGFKINADPINIPLKTYPSFKVLRTIPGQGANAAALDGMYVCSNSPLSEPGQAGLSSYIETDGYIVYGRWSESTYISNFFSGYDNCNQGEFETNLRYGLLPETNYSLKLSLTDEFGQSSNQQLAFTTEAPKEQYTRFHNLQQQYNVTPPDRTTLTYAVENLEFVDLHLCKLEPEIFLERTVNRADNFTPPQGAGCLQVITKKIALPARYFVNNYFQVNLADYFPEPRGHYIVTFSNALYTGTTYENGLEKKKQQYDRTYVSVTNIAVGKKEVESSENSYSYSNNPAAGRLLNQTLAASSNLYWVNNSQTLTPLNGASVVQFAGGGEAGFRRRATGFTNPSGIAQVAVEENLVGAVIHSGIDSAVITDWADTLQGAGEARNASRTYLYTDRPIYRPGHTVHIRGIDRIGFDGTYEVWNQGPVKLEIFDSKWQSVFETNLKMTEYGTFNTDFELPADAPLGTYRIEVFGNSSWFDVEQYVPAAFKLETEANQEEFINGDTLKLAVQADYYFGVPLSEGTVTYSVTAQDYYFDKYTDEYFNFGGGWYYCYYCGYGDDFLFRGETTLNENGRGVIERTLNFSDFFDDVATEGSKIVTVSITVKDINGRSVSSQQSFVVHKGEFYLGAKTDEYYTSVNTPVTFRVKTVNTAGASESLRGIERKTYKINWETFKRQEVDGGFYYRSEKKLEEMASERINTNDQGDYQGQLTFTEEGQYEVHVTKADERGNLMQTISTIYIYGDQSVSVPPNNNYELDIEVQRTDLDAGETASMLIKSPYDIAKVLITVERGTVYDYWIADVKGGLYLHEFPIKPEYAPNIFVSALLLSPDPEVKHGSVRFEVGSDKNELDIEVTANKTHYLPGEEVTLQVKTKDHTGRPVPAEVSLSVADLSVLALKGNPKKNPALFFYDGFPLSVTTASNIKNILYEIDIPLGTKGGGGASPDDLANKKRGEFKDTAFWDARVVTDAAGNATISFTLPDNLTTWQIEGLGVTTDTKLGVYYAEFTTKKDLMAVPLKPRFVVPGDRFMLGAKVFNQTTKGTSVDIKLESETLVFTGRQADQVFINEGEEKTVYFEVVAPSGVTAGSHVFTFTASAETFVDSVEQTIAITPNATYETVATANFTKADKAIEYLYVPEEVLSGEGGLTINANATMAVFMTDALSYMVTYPYGSSEQLTSSLSTIGTLTSALSIPNVEGEFESIIHLGVTYTVAEVVTSGLAQVYQSQTLNGGFSYYKGLRPDLSLTLHVVTALTNLQKAGYNVRADVLERAVVYVAAETRRLYTQSPAAHSETVVLAEYVLREANGGKKTALTDIVENLLSDKAFINEKISSLPLAYLAILTADGFSRSAKKQVYEALTNRIDIDGRGAYLTNGPTTNRNYFETPTKNTALLLKAFSAHGDEHPAMANVLRWLLAARDRQGVWGNTHNTFVVVDSMIDYLKWQHETESHFTLRGLLAGVEIFGYEFSPKNVFKTFTHFIPIDSLARQTLLPIVLEKENHTDTSNNLYYDMALKYFLPAASLPPRDEGITIERGLYALEDTREQNPLQSVAVGDVVKGKLTLTIPDAYSHVAIEDSIPAGFEIINFSLDTEDQSLQNNDWQGGVSRPTAGGWLPGLFGSSQVAQTFGPSGFGGSFGNDTRTLWPTHTESHDDRVLLYVESISAGVYEYEYFLRALVPGEFQHLPAKAEELFFPEVFGRTGGGTVKVTLE